ncbi:two-component system response regulator [Gordonibacter pamelaeae]|uniref:two-component system response regulator n=1 Tax=Gordonibacter pamelaeae TaxID=471189 RepID=UPI00242FC05A|nr:EAL domain-containing protein [Gordonibacter pamelaeae]
MNGGRGMRADKKILAVEADEDCRTNLLPALSSRYTVLEAEDGDQALKLLEDQGADFALVLANASRPAPDGRPFPERLKTDPRFASLPVVAISPEAGEEEEMAALSHGADGFIPRPCRTELALCRVAAVMRLCESVALAKQARYDDIADVYSKSYFYQRVRDILLRNPATSYDILCSDIEDFKLINDTIGIVAGDRLLRQVGKLHASLLGDHGICGRLSADRFACLIEHREDYSDEMFTQSTARIKSGFGNRNVVLKYGIYRVEDREVPVEQMCDRALLAVQSIKGQYGKHFAFYDDKLRDTLLHRQAITDGMERALASGQFEVYLQPKFRIADGSLSGAEALVRWNHPEWGLQPPSEFIPLFERNGFITKLDQYVWEQACSLMRRWDLMGFPRIDVSVNVSRTDIRDMDMARVLGGLIERYGLDPSRLHLEITESACKDSADQLVETLHRLRKMGFVIEMDDFGSGYSSLNMLTEMPLDVLKLDMKFIQTEVANPSGDSILGFIVSLARWMELSVVAEGVETREQLERLQADGCDYAQGYFLARPMPVKALEELLASPPGCER